MKKRQKNNIYGIEIPSLEDEISESLKLALSDDDYSIAIDIVNRCRELSKLFMRAKDTDKAILILETMLSFCYKINELSKPQFIFKDVEELILMYQFKHDKKSIISLLDFLIQKYPDFSNVIIWEKLLTAYKKKK